MLHIARKEDWEAAKRSGTYSLPGSVIQGCSREQLAMVVDAHFQSLDGWVVLTVDESQASGEVRLVTHSDGKRTETFPHLHGTFPSTAVSRVEALEAAVGARSPEGYDRGPAAERIRAARERAGLIAIEVAGATNLGNDAYFDLEWDDDEAFEAISLDQLGRLAVKLGLTAVEIVRPTGAAPVREPIAMDDLITAIETRVRSLGESVDAFGDRVGWGVESALGDPRAAWHDWNVDGLQDICRELGFDWMRILASWTPRS